jgi:uncharacterized protein (TIGR03545 family)
MKNSSDKAIARGPLRTGAIAPTLIIILMVGVYFKFFFDGHLRRALEWAGTHVIGAEVDVARVHTSFLHASLDIEDIEITDKEHPERDLVQIGSIQFAALWDALLRAKIVVDEASILDIQSLVPRRHPGYVLPPPPPNHGPSALDQVETSVLEQTRKNYNGNFLGDVAGLLGGGNVNDQLKELQGQLKSDQKIKELQKELAEKKKQWDQRLKQLPQDKELQAYSARVKALKFDFKNPGELGKNLQAAQKIIAEASEKVKVIDQTQRDLKADINTYSQQYKDLEKLVQQDVHDLQGRLKLPNIDAKEFSEQLFITMIEKKLGGMAKYVELARHYMPAKETPAQAKAAKEKAQEDAILPHQRGQGTSYRFPITTGYPLLWLKHAAISSQASAGEYSGNIKGEIKDLTTDPVALGRPAVIHVAGDFPKQRIEGLDAHITLDHTTDTPRESLNLKIARFPITEQKLSDSPDVRLALQQAQASSTMESVFVNDELTLHSQNTFGDIKYDLAAKSPVVQEIIDNILKGIPQITVNADAKGSLHNLDLHVNSNLGSELSKGFQKQLQAKIDQAQGRLKKLIDQKIGGNRDQLKSEMDKMTGDLSKNLDAKKGQVDKLTKDAKSQMDNSKNNPLKGLW